jgi:hypothetical protein
MTGHATSFEPCRVGRLLTAFARGKISLVARVGRALNRDKREMDDVCCNGW